MGPEGMSNREKREKNADEEISAIFFWFRKHKLSTSDQEYLLRKKNTFSNYLGLESHFPGVQRSLLGHFPHQLEVYLDY